MNQKRLTIIAVASGIACAACVLAFMSSVQGQADAARAEVLARYGGEQVEVCVALRDIGTGEKVDAGSVASKLWIADLLPDGAIASTQAVMGKTVTSPILKGEVVTEKRFEASRTSLEVPAGKAAISVPARTVQAVGGAILPGMSVDVYASGDTTTSAIARNVTVLDTSLVDSQGSRASDMAWVTLAVEPAKVQELVAATARTELYFVLPGETAPAEDKGSEPK